MSVFIHYLARLNAIEKVVGKKAIFLAMYVFAYAFFIAIAVICLIGSVVNGSVVFAYAIIFVVRLGKLR